jgi:ABC-type spermidine/putrescine transport system permease subunit I
MMYGQIIADQFGITFNWAWGGTLALFLMVVALTWILSIGRWVKLRKIFVEDEMVGTSAVVLTLYAIGVYALIYAPIVMLAIYSFNDAMFITPTWDGFTLRWYRALLENPNLHEAFRNSFTLGLATAAISAIIGVAFSPFESPF